MIREHGAGQAEIVHQILCNVFGSNLVALVRSVNGGNRAGTSQNSGK